MESARSFRKLYQSQIILRIDSERCFADAATERCNTKSARYPCFLTEKSANHLKKSGGAGRIADRHTKNRCAFIIHLATHFRTCERSIFILYVMRRVVKKFVLTFKGLGGNMKLKTKRISQNQWKGRALAKFCRTESGHSSWKCLWQNAFVYHPGERVSLQYKESTTQRQRYRPKMRDTSLSRDV